MHPNKHNLIGQKFGQLEVIQEADDYISPKNGRHRTRWLCRCSCGHTKAILAESLCSGATARCGECYQIIPCGNCMKYICPNGDYFLFDPDDMEIAKSRIWGIKKGYARATIQGVSVGFHRIVMNATEDDVVDHIDCNGRNNCKSNLRLVSQCENMRNARTRRDNSTGYKGVSYDKRMKRYAAYICISGKKKHIGFFDTAQSAAVAYNNAALHYFGDCARLNAIEKPFATYTSNTPNTMIA